VSVVAPKDVEKKGRDSPFWSNTKPAWLIFLRGVIEMNLKEKCMEELRKQIESLMSSNHELVKLLEEVLRVNEEYAVEIDRLSGKK